MILQCGLDLHYLEPNRCFTDLLAARSMYARAPEPGTARIHVYQKPQHVSRGDLIANYLANLDSNQSESFGRGICLSGCGSHPPKGYS